MLNAHSGDNWIHMAVATYKVQPFEYVANLFFSPSFSCCYVSLCFLNGCRLCLSVSQSVRRTFVCSFVGWFVRWFGRSHARYFINTLHAKHYYSKTIHIRNGHVSLSRSQHIILKQQIQKISSIHEAVVCVYELNDRFDSVRKTDT